MDILDLINKDTDVFRGIFDLVKVGFKLQHARGYLRSESADAHDAGSQSDGFSHFG
jgi:hypothetical protein